MSGGKRRSSIQNQQFGMMLGLKGRSNEHHVPILSTSSTASSSLSRSLQLTFTLPFIMDLPRHSTPPPPRPPRAHFRNYGNLDTHVPSGSPTTSPNYRRGAGIRTRAPRTPPPFPSPVDPAIFSISPIRRRMAARRAELDRELDLLMASPQGPSIDSFETATETAITGERPAESTGEQLDFQHWTTNVSGICPIFRWAV